jgi:hypothetical protein
MIGEKFLCVCCAEPHPEEEAKFDPQLNGPVCEHCRFLLLGATAWLKKAKITRPLAPTDINQDNYKRFKGYK